MSCEIHDFVFGASNFSPHRSTVLYVRALDPCDERDRSELRELACDHQVRALMSSRQLKFAAPQGIRVSRGVERTLQAGRRCGGAPFALLGSVPRSRVEAVIGGVCKDERTEIERQRAQEQVIPLPERVGYGAVERAHAFRFELRTDEALQIMLRLEPALDAPAQDCFVARIEHYAEPGGAPASRQLLAAAGGRESREAGPELLGAITALFVLPYDPF